MTLRRLVPLGLGLAVLLAPEPARACSCSGTPTPDLESCQTAARVYAGTVEAVDVPFLFELENATVVRLNVDTVWRGDPPAGLLAYTGGIGGCGTIMPTPGSPFLACEDDVGDISWMRFSMCNYPLFDEAPEIRAVLGPGRPPTAAAVRQWRGWRTEDLLFSLALILACPLLGTTVGAALGRRSRRRATQAIEATPSPIRGLLLLAAAILIARLGLRATLPVGFEGLLRASGEHGPIVACATVVIATLVGLWLGYRGQRQPGRRGPWRGLALAFIGVGLVLFAGFARLHVPIQPADADACSAARAREFLRTAPILGNFRADEENEWDPSPATVAVREEALSVAHDALPYACADWGLRRMRFDPDDSCVEYEDGIGGTYRKCVDPRWDSYNEEPPG